MTTPDFTPATYVSLRDAAINEQRLQSLIDENPGLLDLGDVVVRTLELRQRGGGRLDMLLEDREQGIWYEVEIQLGAVDESHIIRTIEYWDTQRRRFPQYEHVAVIVAEDVTSRFLNVISLLNGQIPLMAVQIRGVEVGEHFTLVATRVVDLVRLGADWEDVGETVDRDYWARRASASSLELVDKMLELIQEVAPDAELKFNKAYIGLRVGGQVRNFIVFNPRQGATVLAEFRIRLSTDTQTQLEESDLLVRSYNYTYGRGYSISIRHDDLENQRGLLLDLVRAAHDDEHLPPQPPSR